jgi:hypothetical protein
VIYTSAFLSSEVLSDDDDDDFSPPKSSVPQHDDEDDDAGGEIPPTRRMTPWRCLQTIRRYSNSSSTSASVLLAHMTDTSSSPSTRRRYRNLVLGQGDAERMAWEAFINSRRGVANQPGLQRTNRAGTASYVRLKTAGESQSLPAHEFWLTGQCLHPRCLALCDDCKISHPVIQHQSISIHVRVVVSSEYLFIVDIS